MRRAFSTLGDVDLTVEAACALARRFSLSALELRGLGGRLDVPAYLTTTFGEPRRFADCCAAAGVSVVALDTSHWLMRPSAESRAELEAYVPWAEAVGCARLRVFDGGTTLTSEELDLGCAELAWWNERRQAAGWQCDLMIETHDALITSERLQRFLHAAPAGTTLLWDAHHTWRKGGEDPAQTWSAIGPAVAHIHVKDSIGQSWAQYPFTYVLPGDGEFPMQRLREALAADGFDGVLSLEWEQKWHPYLDPLSDALAAAQERRWW